MKRCEGKNDKVKYCVLLCGDDEDQEVSDDSIAEFYYSEEIINSENPFLSFLTCFSFLIIFDPWRGASYIRKEFFVPVMELLLICDQCPPPHLGVH